MSATEFPNKKLIFQLHKVTFLLDKIAALTLQQKLGLPHSQFFMLMALRRHQELSQREIADFHGVTEAAVSRHIEPLRAKRLIERRQNQASRRQYNIVLTAKGDKLVHQALSILDRKFEKIFSVLGRTGKSRLEHSLESIRDYIVTHKEIPGYRPRLGRHSQQARGPAPKKTPA